jgi:hypothetical protein
MMGHDGALLLWRLGEAHAKHFGQGSLYTEHLSWIVVDEDEGTEW